jgi:ATP-dependent DNA ligase
MTMLCQKIEKSHLPLFVEVSGDKWVAEPKLDGIRCIFQSVKGKIKLSNRRGIDITHQFPEFENFKLEGCDSVTLDCELVVLDINGIDQFNEGISFRTHCKSDSSIKESMSKYPASLVVFDILELDGNNLRLKPLKERREILERVSDLFKSHHSINLVEQTPSDRGSILNLWERMVEQGREGIILKNVNSTYEDGKRTSNWRKVKNIKEVDLTFQRYDVNPQGITVENTEGIRVLVAGQHQYAVRQALDQVGKVTISVRHLGETKAGKYRQPVYHQMVEVQTAKDVVKQVMGA